MSYLDIDVDTGPVLAYIARVERHLSPPSLEMFLRERETPALLLRMERRFANQGDDVSGRWAPLEVSTMMRRVREGYPATPTNVRSGSMRDYLLTSEQFLPLGSGVEMQIPGPSGRGEMASKIRVAQRGGRAPGAGKDTPPRPVLGVNPTDMRIFMTNFEVWLQGVLN